MLNAGVASLPLAIGQTFPGILVFTYKDDILPFLLRSINIQVILVAMPYNLACCYCIGHQESGAASLSRRS
jgi:hypothetical protein